MCNCITWHHPVWRAAAKIARCQPDTVFAVFSALEADGARLRPEILAAGLGRRAFVIERVLDALAALGVTVEGIVASAWRPNRTPNAQPDEQPSAASENRTQTQREPDTAVGARALSTNRSSVRSRRKYWRDKAAEALSPANRTQAMQPDAPAKSAPLSLIPTSVYQEGRKEVKMESARASPQQLGLLLPVKGGANKDQAMTGEVDGRSARGSRLPEDWQPGAAETAYAEQLGLDVADTTDRFRDYWSDQPGAKGRKLAWTGTWRNWCRGDADKQRTKSRGSTARKSPVENLYAGFAAAAGFDSGADSAPVEPLLDRRRST